jgi:hypothetical protein
MAERLTPVVKAFAAPRRGEVVSTSRARAGYREGYRGAAQRYPCDVRIAAFHKGGREARLRRRRCLIERFLISRLSEDIDVTVFR